MRPEKQLLLNEIQSQVNGATALVLTRYKRLDPNTAYAFRSKLREQGGSMEVVRKRILKKAFEASGLPFDEEMMGGNIAVIFAAADPIGMTKTLFQFMSENEEMMEVVAGRFEGKPCTAKDVETISKLPSRDEMRSQLLATLEAPMSQTLSVMDSLLTSLVHCLENKNQKS